MLKQLPHKAGVYIMKDTAGSILYIGKAIDLRKRVSHYFRATGQDPKIRALMAEVKHIDYIPAESEREALVIEQRLIHRHQPVYNTMWKDDKSYPFIKISMNEDFPRITLTRQRKRDGARYFGPFPRVTPIKRLLRWIWKKHLFPLRPCPYDFGEKNPPPRKKVRSCLYLHTRECPAPCVGKIAKKDYRRMAEKAILFFEGRHDRLQRDWAREMRAASRRMEYEKAARLRDRLQALEHIHERVTFRALRPDDVRSRIEMSQTLRELQNALQLPKPPQRIDAFDISHIQGSGTVASLVVFENGRPLRSHYRKYRIKSVAGVDDFASMAEVVTRRYRRLVAEGGIAPDLILIDGGPGQLAAAQAALRRLGLLRLPMAALAKREEVVHRAEGHPPLRLPRDSAALQMLQRIRDESHRFAVAYHRVRRKHDTLYQQ